MRGTGAERPVVAVKALQWGWSEGAALFSSVVRPTGDGRSLMDRAKPYDIPKREVWEAYKEGQSQPRGGWRRRPDDFGLRG